METRLKVGLMLLLIGFMDCKGGEDEQNDAGIGKKDGGWSADGSSESQQIDSGQKESGVDAGTANGEANDGEMKDRHGEEAGVDGRTVDGEVYDSQIGEGGGDEKPGALNVVRFQDSYCKSGTSYSELFSGRDTWQYDGLQCISWDVSEPDQTRFDFINFGEMCGFYLGNGNLWRGYAYSNEEGSLQLDIEWNFSDPNACGSCFYDFSFEIADIEIGESLDIELATRGCTMGCPWSRYFAVLPVSESPTGIVCRYIGDKYLISSSYSYWELGKLHLPPNEDVCDEGLTVVEVDQGYKICLASCSDIEPCPLEEILECQEGICRLSETW